MFGMKRPKTFMITYNLKLHDGKDIYLKLGQTKQNTQWVSVAQP